MDNSLVATTFSNASSLPSAGTAVRRTTPNRTIPPSLPRVSTTPDEAADPALRMQRAGSGPARSRTLRLLTTPPGNATA